MCLSRGLLRWYSWEHPWQNLQRSCIDGISHNIVSLFNPVSCRYLCYINDFNRPPVYTRDPHSLFIAPADGLALSGTTPSACAVASTKLHMYVEVVVIDGIVFLEPQWRHLCWVTRCEEISRHFEYKLETVYRVCWWNVCFVTVWYGIIMTQIFHVLMMACYLVDHSYEVGIAYICYWQTISYWMVICGLRMIDSSLGVIWDACLIWIRSVYKFTNAYSNTWNEIRFSWYGYWLNMPCKLELISVLIHW